jgi:hypothetical protein
MRLVKERAEVETYIQVFTHCLNGRGVDAQAMAS